MTKSVYVLDSKHPTMGGNRLYFSRERAYEDALFNLETALRTQKKSVEDDEAKRMAREFVEKNLMRYVPEVVT